MPVTAGRLPRQSTERERAAAALVVRFSLILSQMYNKFSFLSTLF